MPFLRKKEIAQIFASFDDRDYYTVIRDFFEMSAISIRNAVDIGHQREYYEERYKTIASGYTEAHRLKFARALGIFIEEIQKAVDGDAPFCDWCGELYMESGTSNSRMGQFFTPYPVSQLLPQGIISEKDVRAKIGDGDGVFTLYEPTCGAGGLIVAAIEKLRTMGVNYAHNIFVDCGDIDSRCVCMTYLTLSLLGVPAVVRLGDALKLEYREAWFTPAYIVNCAHFYHQIGCGSYPYTATIPKSAAPKEVSAPTETRALNPPTPSTPQTPMEEERIHHHCHCLDRKFTFAEWGNYLKAHPDSGRESVFEEFGYKWNINDICINPHRINIVPRKGGAVLLEIATAKTKRGWCFGIDYSGIEEDASSGGGYGVYYDSRDDESFNTENGAIIAALKKVRKKPHLRKEYAALIDLEVSMRQNPQLTLF